MRRLVTEVHEDLGLQRTPDSMRIDSPARSAEPRNLDAPHDSVWTILYSDGSNVTVTLDANDSDQIVKEKLKEAISS